MRYTLAKFFEKLLPKPVFGDNMSLTGFGDIVSLKYLLFTHNPL